MDGGAYSPEPAVAEGAATQSDEERQIQVATALSVAESTGQQALPAQASEEDADLRMALALSLQSSAIASSATEPPTTAHPASSSSKTARSKLLCLIRHGQGVHNPRENKLALSFIPGMLRRDAPLTRKGREQAGKLQRPLHHLPYDLIVVSPLSRTIQTATEAFADHPTPKMLNHLMCERATMPADVGTPKERLLQKHPQIASWQGFDDLPEQFWPQRSFRTAEEEVAARVSEFKEWLLARAETCLALVGHSAFFSTMTGLPKLANCEAFWCQLNPDGTITECMALPPPPCAEDDVIHG
uniref:Phosphoglycerate mutase-like protein n=1 Tax=Haptolina brevifila TaxID=156173 RepID=A0A7S2IPY8_9EUKA|mmetsp:Transcript_69091/g.137015  ORF Transcript_69091/g.137015 Transcript_69091/m.137015 type:complete len:300 (+) Transcript_69091:26-925(+)